MNVENTFVITALQQTRQHFRYFELEVPAQLEADLADVDKVAARMGHTYEPGKLLDRVWDALAADRDPVTDKAVAAQLHADLLWKQNLGPALDGRISREKAAAITKHAPAILKAMAPVVTAADKAIAAAHAVIPGLNISSTNAMTTVPAVHATAWAQARETAIKLTRAHQVWELVARTARLVKPTSFNAPGLPGLVFAELSPDELDALAEVSAAATGSSGADPWAVALVQAGHRLNYAADPAEYNDRAQAIADYRAAVRQAEREAYERGTAPKAVTLTRIRSGQVLDRFSV
ncbi:hypothetical protein [Nocardia sp. NPDC057227]|uniref:hypothetical protein n=1 Tax=Nocardia sp. NPDC057227 TaxID=3346056 RepID=UPI0036339E89